MAYLIESYGGRRNLVVLNSIHYTIIGGGNNDICRQLAIEWRKRQLKYFFSVMSVFVCIRNACCEHRVTLYDRILHKSKRLKRNYKESIENVSLIS